MTILEKALEHVAVIDDFFPDGDHFICCETPDGFVGLTKTFCGKEIFDASTEAVAEVDCNDCMMKAYGSNHCPLGKVCDDRIL